MDGPYTYVAVDIESGYSSFELERAHALGLPVFVGMKPYQDDDDPELYYETPVVVAGPPPTGNFQPLATATEEALTPALRDPYYPFPPLRTAAEFDDIFSRIERPPPRYRYFQLDRQSRVVARMDYNECYGPEFETARVMPYIVGAIPEVDVLKLRAQQVHGSELRQQLGIATVDEIAAANGFHQRARSFLYHWADFGASEATRALRAELVTDITATALLAPLMTPRQYAFHAERFRHLMGVFPGDEKYLVQA